MSIRLHSDILRAVPTSQVSRERILDAAAKLFREHGYQGTTVRDIGKTVGLLSGSLFYHFRSKEVMLLEIMREAASQMCERAEATVAAAHRPVDMLRALIRMELDCLIGEATTDYYAVLIFEWREVPTAEKPAIAALRQRYRSIWRSTIAACADEGQLRCEAEAVRHTLHSAQIGTLMWFKQSGRYSVPEYANILAGLVLK